MQMMHQQPLAHVRVTDRQTLLANADAASANCVCTCLGTYVQDPMHKALKPLAAPLRQVCAASLTRS